MVVRTDNIEVAGDIVQDLAGYLGISELQSSADFPHEMSSFKDVLAKVAVFMFHVIKSECPASIKHSALF